MKALILLIFLMTSSSAFSGITSIGNGGGLAEMKIFDLYQQTHKIILLCLDDHFCEDDVILRNAIALKGTQALVNTTCTSPFIHSVNPTYAVDSCFLYDSNHSPKSTSTLFEVAATLKILNANSPLEVRSAADMARKLKIFFESRLSLNELSVVLWKNSNFEKIKIEKISTHEKILSHAFYVETEKRTFNLISLFSKASSCENSDVPSLNFSGFTIQNQTENQLNVRLNFTSTCGLKTQLNTAYLKLLLNSHNELESEIRIRKNEF